MKLKRILTSVDFSHEVEHSKNGFCVDITQMYEPVIEWRDIFSAMKKLSEAFGTDDISQEEIRRPGCETCDFRSEYGHKLWVNNPTKNLDVEEVFIDFSK